jgi:hypothetical protein
MNPRAAKPGQRLQYTRVHNETGDESERRLDKRETDDDREREGSGDPFVYAHASTVAPRQVGRKGGSPGRYRLVA